MRQVPLGCGADICLVYQDEGSEVLQAPAFLVSNLGLLVSHFAFQACASVNSGASSLASIIHAHCLISETALSDSASSHPTLPPLICITIETTPSLSLIGLTSNCRGVWRRVGVAGNIYVCVKGWNDNKSRTVGWKVGTKETRVILVPVVIGAANRDEENTSRSTLSLPPQT